MTPLSGNNIIQQKLMLIENDNQHIQQDMLSNYYSWFKKAHFKKRHVSQTASRNPTLPFIPKNISRR